MKVAAAIVALAQASPAWLVENWWQAAQEVYAWASANPEDFRNAAVSMGNRYDALWNFCNADGSDEVSGAEFTACAAAAANHFGMQEGTKQYLYDFGVKYWDVIDRDGSGGFSENEFKGGIAAFVGTNAKVLLKAYDSNDDGILSGQELSDWRAMFETRADKFGVDLTPEKVQAMQAAWADAQTDGDASTGTLFELAKFQLNVFNGLLA
ncbi:Oidioi.mRNA.OKI2018_I69.PAR.g9523.t1.cds [Oikopleura dioica]|uniref:Oidioi.mRNA.OKI2018_I69.PAR.g9523.t1.cds n=1 Tax=Oikopleura dioica TaxID=34765 RepID=A0ABN7RL58_OIKDI|nr:Oidioi.mRNA.OKI2018_I69.PAR.g9523.t1.cds [Oikopleura dioica]